MAFTISSALSCCPSLHSPIRLHPRPLISVSAFPPSSVRFPKIIPRNARVICATASAAGSSGSSGDINPFPKIIPRNARVICAAASAAGSSGSSGDINPYEVLGVNPIEGFDTIKAAYTKKRKDAERRGDEATASQLERAYDKIMMAQLMKRKKGETFGNFEVSKNIKYADKAPLIPWGPRPCKSELKDVQINLAISAVFTAWIFIIRSAEWLPLQFLTAVYVYRIFEKLRSFESPQSTTFTEEGEDEGRLLRMGKRLLRSCALVFGSVAIASVAFTMVLNVIEYTGNYIPALLYNSQDIFVTAVSAAMLFLITSYYR